MHKKYHKKFKILDILVVTTQAREGIETRTRIEKDDQGEVTTQAREGIETFFAVKIKPNFAVTTQAREGIETSVPAEMLQAASRNNSSPWGSSACPRQKSINFIKVL